MKCVPVLKALGCASVASVASVAAIISAYGVPTQETAIARTKEMSVIAFLVFLYVFSREKWS